MAEKTKSGVVREALGKGITATEDVLAYAKKRGVTVNNQDVYSVKSLMKKTGQLPSSNAQSAAATAKKKPAAKSPPAKKPQSAATGLADDVAMVKKLKQKLGGGELKKLVDVVD